MIEKVAYRNFKTLRDVTIDLGPLTVLVGPNGCGKTSALDGIYYLSLLRERPPERIFKERRAPDILRSTAVPDGEGLGITLFSRRGSVRSAFELEERADRRGFELDHSGGEERHSELLPRARRPRLDLEALAEPAAIDDITLCEDGRGLVSHLAHLRVIKPDRFEQIEAQLRRIVPPIKKLHIRETKVWREPPPSSSWNPELTAELVPGYELRFDTSGGTAIPAHAMSEGTLLMLGLLTILHSTSPDVVLIDDIERGLHPAAFEVFVKSLRSLIETPPQLQVLITSHAPYLLESFNPDEVRLMRLGDEGYTECLPMTGHPQFNEWKDIMTTGELWTIFDNGGFEE